MADAGSRAALARRRLLGRGLLCDDRSVDPTDLGRDLVLRPDGKDLAFVDGADNLGQALTLAFTTRLGADVFNVDFGFDGLNALTQDIPPLIAQERIRVAVIALLTKDPRVRRIVDVSFADGRLLPPGTPDRVLRVTVVFETVTGDTTTVDLGEVPHG